MVIQYTKIIYISNLNYSNTLEDNEDNLLIIPEHLSFLKYSLKYKNIRLKIIWWLSLDNYFGYKFRGKFTNFKIFN